MNKTAKSKLMQELEFDSSVNDVSTKGNESSCFIIDLMALVQSAVTQNSILFGDLAVCLSQAQAVTNAFRYANTVVICPDRYDVEESIKCFERSRRKKAFVPERKIMHDNQALPSNFKEFLMNPKNKCNCKFSFRFLDIILQAQISRITKVTNRTYRWFDNRSSGKQREKRRNSSK